ncbi:transcriptional regulator [Thioclava sp. F36-7]|nr:transcriptional regulator [Thioclava sp. F36-7]
MWKGRSAMALKIEQQRGVGVQSVGRALRLLDLLGQSNEGERVSDLARMSGLAVSTAHRLLTTLENSGYAHFDQVNSLWRVGRQAYLVGTAYTRRRNLVAPAFPIMRRLRNATRETVNLGILDQDYLVTIAQSESREIVRAIAPPGGRVPVFCSAMGKAILTTWPDDDIVALAHRVGFHTLTSRSHRNISSLVADIQVCRERGYAIDDGEHATGLRCVGAAIWSPNGEAVGAISVSALSSRLVGPRIFEVGTLVREASRDLTRQLGSGRGLESFVESSQPEVP